MIRITRLTDYGIVLLSRFAAAEPGSVLSARELADGSHLPLPTVGKILKTLARASLLVSHRGTLGGYSLARSADQVSVADVIQALEGPIALTDCASDAPGTCGIERSCPVRGNWVRITGAVRDALAGIPLAEMAEPLKGGRARRSMQHVAAAGPSAPPPHPERRPS